MNNVFTPSLTLEPLYCDTETASKVCGFDVVAVAGVCVSNERIWIGSGNLVCSFDIESGSFLSFIKLSSHFKVSDLCSDGVLLYIIDSSNSPGRTIITVELDTSKVISGMVTWKNRFCYLRTTYGMDYLGKSIFVLSRPNGLIDRAVFEVSPRSARVMGVERLDFSTCENRCVVGLAVTEDYTYTLESYNRDEGYVSILHCFDRASGESVFEIDLEVSVTSLCYFNESYYFPENIALGRIGGKVPHVLERPQSLVVYKLSQNGSNRWDYLNCNRHD